MSNNYSTINTFNQAPSSAQIIAYLLFVLQVVTFYSIIQLRISSSTSFIILHILYGISIIGQFAFTLRTSLIDPSDMVMVLYRRNPSEYICPDVA